MPRASILIIDFCDDLVLVEGGLADALEAEFLDAEIGGLLDQGFGRCPKTGKASICPQDCSKARSGLRG